MIYHMSTYVNGFLFLLTVGPRFIVNPTARQDIVINGTFMLHCSAEGFPGPSIWWYMSDKIITVGVTSVAEPINVNNSTLTISNVGFNDSGVYYCRAVNNVTLVTSTLANITVVGKLVNDIK